MQDTSDAHQRSAAVSAPPGGVSIRPAVPVEEDLPAPGRRLIDRVWPVLVVVLVAAGFSLAYLGGGLWAGGDAWRGNPGDPEQFMWFLAWMPHAIPQAILHGHNPLVTDYQLFPRGVNLMWNTSVVLPAVLMSPITVLAGPVVTYNLLVVLGPVATSATSYWAFHRYVGSRLAAGLGALAFGFSPFIVTHGPAGHVHMALLALMPVTLVLVDELLIRQRRRSWLVGGLLGIVAACQLLTSEEILVIELVTGAVALIVLCLVHRDGVRSRVGYVLGGAGSAAVTFLVLAGYPLYVQLLGPRRAPGVHSPEAYSTDLLNLVWPINQWLDFGVKSDPGFTGNNSEWTAYLGIPLLALLVAVVVVARRRRPLVPILAICLVVIEVLSFGPHLHVDGHKVLPLPWSGLVHVPLLSNLLPGRLSVSIAFLAALLIAVFVDEIMRARSPRWKLAGAALAAVVAVSMVPGGLPLTRIPTPTFFTTAAQERVPDGSVALVVPYIEGPHNEQASLWQANGGMRFRMVDGWMIAPGLHWGGPNAVSVAIDHAATITVTPAVRDAVVNELRARRVRTVIVGPTNDRPAVVGLFTRVLGRPPTTVGGVQLWTVPRPGR